MTEDDPHVLPHAWGLDGSRLVDAHRRRIARALEAAASLDDVLEAAAMTIALAVVGRLDEVPRTERTALAKRTRRALLTLGAEADEDAREALELAAKMARRGIVVLDGGALPDERRAVDPPTARDVGRLLAGELDGFAAADVALRLRDNPDVRRALATLAPALTAPAVLSRPRVRLAADAAPEVRDPASGRLVGAREVEGAALEAFSFADGVLAVYAEPPVALRVRASVDGTPLPRARETMGYAELPIPDGTTDVELTIELGEQALDWNLSLDPDRTS
jgi:hypothetical protein